MLKSMGKRDLQKILSKSPRFIIKKDFPKIEFVQPESSGFLWLYPELRKSVWFKTPYSSTD